MTRFFRPPISLLIVILLAITGLSTIQPVAAANEQARGELNGWGATVWSMGASLGGSFIYATDQITAANDAESEFKFFKDTNQWFGKDAPNNITFGAIFTGVSTGGGGERNLRFNHIQNSYYVFKWNGADRGALFQLTAAPVNITAVSQSPTNPNASQSVTVSATTSAPPPAEQALWLRYALNGNWSGSTVVKMSGSGLNYSAIIPAQSNGTAVSYYIFSSGDVASITGSDADLMTITYNNNSGANYGYTVATASGISDARALWLETTVIGWNGAAGSGYKLLYDPDGNIVPATAGATACVFPLSVPCYVNLNQSGTVSGYVKNPNATGLIRLTNSLNNDQAKELLRGQTAVASYNSGGDLIQISGVQIQSVLDYLYVDNGTADNALLGVTYSGGVPSVHLWAPTAQNVILRRYADSTTTSYSPHPMTRDDASGVWSVTGDATWDRQFYLFDVQVYVPLVNEVLNNIVTDPYAVSLSTDSLRSQFVNLGDGDLKPAGWDSLSKPALNNFTDITVYEMHVRDFSINDATVAEAHRGTYVAFTYDGLVNSLSDGMTHLLALQEAGLTHVHLLPAFDIATVPEAAVPRNVWPNPTGYGRDSDQQQTIVGDNRADDGFNWGYDPFHFGVPEGSYATDPDGEQRILEFREMVQVLNQNGLRVVMDVVYNHTAASGLWDKSVLDKVVPGYYHRYTTNGALYTSSCCDDTASEYAMFEKLMIDTLIRFAVDYKVDGFRFDLMNLHTRQNMINVQTAITAIDPDIYLYGEGWTFGSAQEKGLTNCPHCFADKYNMTGVGIGLFNDIIRDAAHGGYNQDPLQIRKQGFINGLSYDWNGYEYAQRFQSDLHASMNTLRSGLRASGSDWGGFGGPFAASPQESMPYISKHDNETLFDQNVFKMPAGVSMAERVRAQNLGLSVIALSQGVPFFHMASDILRSKSLDRNSYDSGDWFNRVYWDYSDNNFGVGLPPAWENSSRWGIMGPHLNNTALDPTTGDIQFAAAHFRELLRIRQSSSLFRLTEMSQVNNQVVFFNGDNSVDGLIVMGLLNDATPGANWETIVVFFNADKTTQNIAIAGADGFTLHPLHTNGVDDDPVITGGASFNDATDVFTIPARTTAVFVSNQPLLPASTIDWVGKMWPRGSVAHQINEGNFAPASFDVYARVYEAGVTPDPGAPAGIACYLYWGKYGESWSSLPMSWNAQLGNDDEFKGTITQAVINDLAPGSYGFTVYCQKPGEGRSWKVDEYDIDFAGDNDQGDGLFTIVPTADPSPSPAGGVFVHLFEWSWNDIAQECAWLGEKGYTAVQVSPPQEHRLTSPYTWWARYQPVSYQIVSNSGNLAEFQAMIAACSAAGVDVYVDAVINHMAFGDGVGSGGSSYDSAAMSYPGVPYTGANFHTPCDINSYANRYEVQNCRLLGLPDLSYDNVDTVSKIQAYLNGLIAMGVKGFRIDAAKHMAAYDLERLYAGLDNLPGGGRPYIFQEVIGAGNEPVKEFEYFYMGDVTEFAATNSIGWHFSGKSGCDGALSGLSDYGGAGYMPDRFAQIFVNNHDNQRGHGTGSECVVTYKDGTAHDLANVFLLAHPYGHPSIMSSYYFGNNVGDDNQPPPTTSVYSGGEPVGCNANDWVCEHRRSAIANMVQFRAVTAGEPLTGWTAHSADHISFGRNNKGFVAINRTGANATTTYNTGLSAGVYCDVISGQRSADGLTCTGGSATVNEAGQIVSYTLNSMTAFAIHAQSRLLDTQVIQLQAGWNIISSHIMPHQADMTAVLADIADDVILIKNGAGQFYVPGVFNGIGDWQWDEGYLIQMTEPRDLTIAGQVMPETSSITLGPGWHAIPYLRDTAMDIEEALASLNGSFEIVKNNAGQFYVPDVFNGIGSMIPGQGYLIRMTQAGTLVYPAND
jgi:pullulanase/glycogen debranching enzyme